MFRTTDVAPIIDPETGYALNIPVTEQGAPFWWEDMPDIYSKIRAARAARGIVVDDFPNGPLKRVPVRRAGSIQDRHKAANGEKS